MIARLFDGFAMSIIEHVGSASLLLTLYDLDGSVAKRANTLAGLCVAQSYDIALQIAL
jgi:hypothetical protein